MTPATRQRPSGPRCRPRSKTTCRRRAAAPPRRRPRRIGSWNRCEGGEKGGESSWAWRRGAGGGAGSIDCSAWRFRGISERTGGWSAWARTRLVSGGSVRWMSTTTCANTAVCGLPPRANRVQGMLARASGETDANVR